MRFLHKLLYKLICFILLVNTISALAQTKGFEKELIMSEAEQQMMNDANYYFEQKNYSAALPLFVKLYQNFPERVEHKYSLGVCYTHSENEADKAIPLLEEVLKENPETNDLYYNLARAYQLNNRFDEAIEYFNKALKLKGIDQEMIKDVLNFIENCKNGKELVNNPIDVSIENVGLPINTKGSEYVPIISSDESVLIFTYKGEKSKGGLQNEFGEPDEKGSYYEDLLISYKLGDIWLSPESLGDNINSEGHDACIALSGDGQQLFIYKDDKEGSGDIYVSDLDSNTWTTPVKLNININTKYWEGSASLSPDAKTLYFTSERPGGEGGRDIYKSVQREDGIWGEAINLGTAVNTPFDDDAPFIHPDGKTMYFSSKGHNSMGGYDIFKTESAGENIWTKPLNIGYPVNTAGDDLYYVESANGERGYFSSGRLGGMGQQDIFIIHHKDAAKKHSLLLVKGTVTANGKPSEAKITVSYSDNKLPQGEYKSNSASGKYLISLPGGNDYIISYNVTGFESHVENVIPEKTDSFTERIIDVNLYSGNYVPNLTIEGNVLYGERPIRPSTKVTIFLNNDDKSFIKKETATDSKGHFRFTDLPDNIHYYIALDEKDPDLHAFVSPVIIGEVKLGGKPRKGLPINNVTTDVEGKFRLEVDAKNFLYSNLPASREDLDKLDFTDPEIYQEVLDKFGKKSADQLIFKVQVGAYIKPENFKYGNLKDLGKVDIQLLPDGITRFTIGTLKTLKEAEELRHNAIRKGSPDAFILIFYKGVRRLLAEAVASGFFAP